MSLLARLTLIWCLAGAQSVTAQPGWWMEEPVRLLQTNLRETDSTLDARRLVTQVAEFPANTLLFNLGGIVAQYPTRVAFHYASPHLPPGRDLFGEVLKEAHERGLRVIGRFDLSKTQQPVFEARPAWFFKRTDGEPVIYNGLYATCINGGYYREQALKILAEALERYEVDGLFFNMFGNPAADYSGHPMGPCQCDACRARFQARYGRPLPLWPYSASDNVNRARNSEPAKMAFNLCLSFVDYPFNLYRRLNHAGQNFTHPSPAAGAAPQRPARRGSGRAAARL
jgi:hypothetical protein